MEKTIHKFREASNVLLVKVNIIFFFNKFSYYISIIGEVSTINGEIR